MKHLQNKEQHMKNKLSDLNNHLFAQLERLSDEDLTTEQIDKEVARGKAINDVAKTIVDNAKLVLEAAKLKGDCIIDAVPDVIGIESK